MHYPETIEEAQGYALAALKRLKELGLAANPRNYAIWYEYFAGKNVDLCKAVDTLPATDAPDDAVCNDIFERFILSGANLDAEGGLTGRIEAVAQQIFDALATTSSGTAEYGEALQTFSGGLAGAQNLDQIKGMVSDIIAETTAMDERTRDLHERVTESANEIHELRTALADSRRDALTDGLTGVANRKCFDQALYAAIAGVRETGMSLALILADIDHFKKFNDTHGHQLGDQVLRLVGRTLQMSVRGTDTAARYGGEEFALILPDTTSGGAAAVAENLRRSIASKKLISKGSDKSLGNITMSFGVTSFHPGEDSAEFVARADHALYTAKKLGRNRVICEDVAKVAAG